MAHPSERYIRFLIAQGIGTGEEETSETINTTLRTLRLPAINEEDFDNLVADMQPGFQVQWHNPRHKQTLEWTKKHEIYSLWDPGEDEQNLIELHIRPQVRETVEILLMGRIELEDIAYRIQRKFKIDISAETIFSFRHYFWDVDKSSIAEWMVYLTSGGRWNRDHYLAALTGSKNQALWRAGFNPKVDASKILKDVHSSLAMRFEALRHMPDTKETSEMMTRYSKEISAVHQLIYGEGSQMEENIKELKKFRMQKSSNKPSSLRLIASNGTFSDDGKDKEDE